jgi:hypothetical protein
MRSIRYNYSSMKHILSLLILVLTFVHSFSQSNFEPQLLILAPSNVKYEKSMDSVIAVFNKKIEMQYGKSSEMGKQLNSAEFQKQSVNMKRIAESSYNFGKSMDYGSQISFLSQNYLLYRFYEKFPNLLILLDSNKSDGSLHDLHDMAIRAQMQYILNFPSVEFYKQDGESYSKIRVQLYDQFSNGLLIDSMYIGNSLNPGFEFACENGTFNCTINNALSPSLDGIIREISLNSPTLQNERKLAKERAAVLMNDYYKKPFDKAFISSIIASKDTNINLKNLYQLMVSDDKAKFVGFFLEKVQPQDFRGISKNQRDANVNIISGKSIKDSGFLNAIPQTYAYIVKGVIYKNKWYFEKSNVTYFEPEDNEEGRLQFLNNLQEWNFFAVGSTKPNPDFWETSLFAKIQDKRKDPDWDKYGNNIWKSEEEENRKYIGMYEIVVDQLKEKDQPQIKHVTIH